MVFKGVRRDNIRYKAGLAEKAAQVLAPVQSLALSVFLTHTLLTRKLKERTKRCTLRTEQSYEVT